MDVILIAAPVYVVIGFVTAWVVTPPKERLQLGEFGCLVVLGWPIFLALHLVERGFARSPSAVTHRHRRRLEVDPVVGRVGVAVGDLRPAGQVAVGGRTRDARADRFVTAGSRVEVTAVDEFGLLVRPLPDAEPGRVVSGGDAG